MITVIFTALAAAIRATLTTGLAAYNTRGLSDINEAFHTGATDYVADYDAHN
jgi:hypothetical protein